MGVRFRPLGEGLVQVAQVAGAQVALAVQLPLLAEVEAGLRFSWCVEWMQ